MDRVNRYSLYQEEIPDGYITGIVRDGYNYDTVVAHLYKGDFSDPGYPMCKRGWNRDNGTSYSIWRNNVGAKGICKICLKRAIEGKSPVEPNIDVENFFVEAGYEYCDKCSLEKGYKIYHKNGECIT